ncbi:MAG: MGMT family protein [Candidatus Omnitrophota bacterium]|nr:MGMT family protein [Candidatus Omnitrophota bacterium]
MKGETARFDSRYLDKYLCSKFQRGVILAAGKIPRGKVISYKGLAALAGFKNAARAVGNAMAKNPFPVIIPCHRVVNADGKVGEFQSGRSLKKKLLMSEGIKFDKKGRIPREFFVESKRYQPENS